MKKLMFVFALVLGVSVLSEAQDHAIGVRFGGLRGIGGEVSYQMALGSSNRLELDLGFDSNDNFDAIGLVGIYQWVWPIDAFPQGWSWYAGVGAGVGYWDYEGGNDIAVAANGQLGIEYSFSDIPLQLSLDWRPSFTVIPGTDFGDEDLALGVRYKF